MRSCLFTPFLALVVIALMLAMYVSFWTAPLALFLFWGGWLVYERIRPGTTRHWLRQQRPPAVEGALVEVLPASSSDLDRIGGDQR